ncbi:MAG: sensor histidine kinase [Candidatus Ornithomonoglobus sp.]
MSVKKLRRRVSEALLGYINNKSLMAKFIIIFVFCVFMPIMLSSIIFSYNINKNFYEHESDSLSYFVNSSASEINSIFDEAISLSHVIANDKTIEELAGKRFGSPAEYYSYLTENKPGDYFGVYVSRKGSIDDAIVYLDNDTLLNGGLIWKITETEKNSSFYKDLRDGQNSIILCNEEYVNSQGSVYNGPGIQERLCFIRKLYYGSPGGSMPGYIKISLNMGAVRKALLKDTDYMSVYLVNDEKDLVYVPQENMFYKGEHYMQGIDADRRNIISETGFNNISYLKSWRLVGVYDSSRIRQKQITNVLLVLLVNIIIGMLMMCVVYLIYRSYSDRITRLQMSMRDVENEVFNTVDGSSGTDEIGALTATYNHMVNKINVLINDVYKLEAENKSTELEKTRAELRALQSQVDPHFIFNVLNAILVSSVKNGYTGIVPQISGLSKMIRRLLDWSDDSEPLSIEIDFIETYLQLEKFRFGDRFNYDINIENGADKCNMPKMVVQPLIENACRHGLQGKAGDRYVSVYAGLTDGALTVAVEDNGKGIHADRLKEIQDGLEAEDFDGHIGVKNVYRRLKLYFGDRADMRISSEENKGTRIVIKIYAV